MNIDKTALRSMTNEEMEHIMEKLLNDNVSHPAYYTYGRKYEPVDVIEDWDLGFSLGNAVKYISRAGRKQDYKGQDQLEKTIEDLEKAKFYLNYAIQLKMSKMKNE